MAVTMPNVQFYSPNSWLGTVFAVTPATISATLTELGFYWFDINGVEHQEVFNLSGGEPERRIRFQVPRAGNYSFRVYGRNNIGEYAEITRNLQLSEMYSWTHEDAQRFIYAGQYQNALYDIPDQAGVFFFQWTKNKQQNATRTILNNAQRVVVARSGLWCDGRSWMFKRLIRAEDGSSEAVTGVFTASLSNTTTLQLADFSAGDGMAVWSDPDIVWADMAVMADNSGVSVALYVHSANPLLFPAAISWELRFKRADNAINGPWQTDAESILIENTPNVSPIRAAAYRLYVAPNQEIFILSAVASGYRSKDGGKTWTSWP